MNDPKAAGTQAGGVSSRFAGSSPVPLPHNPLLTADEAGGLRVGVNVIVRPGEPCVCDSDGVDETHQVDYESPQDWVALTGPCPTCAGHGELLIPHALVREFLTEPCPDCRDGRRIVPLYTACPTCAGDPYPCWKCKNKSRVLVGRAAVVSIEPEDDGRNFGIVIDVTELA